MWDLSRGWLRRSWRADQWKTADGSEDWRGCLKAMASSRSQPLREWIYSAFGHVLSLWHTIPLCSCVQPESRVYSRWRHGHSCAVPGGGNGTPLQHSCLENPRDGEPGRLQSVGSLRVGHDWATSLSLFTFMHWRRKWQPTPVFLPGESQGWGSLVGGRLWGRTELDTIEVT